MAGILPETAISATDLPAGISAQEVSPFAWRQKFGKELENPEVLNRLYGYTNAEVGNQGPQAQQAFMESIFNRAHARDQTLAETLSGSYFPQITHFRARQPLSEAQQGHYGDIAQNVLGGSNIANYATGNASGTVGFAGGPRTAGFGGERFGIEGPDARWALNQGYSGPLPILPSFTSTQAGQQPQPFMAAQNVGAQATPPSGVSLFGGGAPNASTGTPGAPGVLGANPLTTAGLNLMQNQPIAPQPWLPLPTMQPLQRPQVNYAGLQALLQRPA